MELFNGFLVFFGLISNLIGHLSIQYSFAFLITSFSVQCTYGDSHAVI